MVELLKSLKIYTVETVLLINIFSVKNKYFEINNRHKSAIMIKEKGETIYYQNCKKYICDSNNVIYIPEGSTYKYRISENGVCYQINFEGILPSNEIIQIPTLDKDVIHLFKKAYEQYSKNKDDQHLLLSIIYEIFSKLINANSNTNPIIKNAIKIIIENISDVNLSNLYISNKLNISEIYLRKLFKKHLNTTPHKYIVDTRLEKSIELLANGYSIKNIISIVGYDSVYSFSRAFKNKYGKSPLNLKKEI